MEREESEPISNIRIICQGRVGGDVARKFATKCVKTLAFSLNLYLGTKD